MSSADRRLVPVTGLTVGVLGALALMIGSLTPWPTHVQVCGATVAVLAYAAIAAALVRNWDDSESRRRR